LATFAAAAPAAAVEPIFVPLPSPHREDPGPCGDAGRRQSALADVTVEPGGVAVITAKGHGTTNIVALGNAGIVLMERPIEVQEPGGPRVVVFRGSTRQTYSCTPECSALVTLGDTGKDYFDKETFQELDPFKKALEQTTTRNVQAAAAGAEQAARHNRTRCQGHSVTAQGMGSAVVDLIFSIAKRDVTFFSGTAAISRL
jgi:hypothetical protein